MSDGSEERLQFDKAEFAQDAPGSAVCAYCQGPIGDTYYEVRAKAACPRCRDAIAAQGTQGSGFGRFARAALFGTLAGAVGAGLWYAVRAISNLEIGLIAILVGYMVGAAVRAGSRGRGGPLYQVLAVFLTYSAIVSTYVPLILGEVRKGARQSETLLAVTLFVLFVSAFVYAAPFLGGFENIIGLLIIGFGVWEAWKINRRIRPQIAGPFRVGAPSLSPAPSRE